MRIKEGLYLTRNGRYAVVQRSLGTGVHCFEGVVLRKKQGQPAIPNSWTEEGVYHHAKEHKFDLVQELPALGEMPATEHWTEYNGGHYVSLLQNTYVEVEFANGSGMSGPPARFIWLWHDPVMTHHPGLRIQRWRPVALPPTELRAPLNGYMLNDPEHFYRKV